MSDGGAAIAIRDLRKVYDGKAAVDGLTLTVPRGSFFGFLGPNGAGKSTTIRMLTGLIAPTSGSIELLGVTMPAEEIAIKQRIGLVPDESLLFDRLTGANSWSSWDVCTALTGLWRFSARGAARAFRTRRGARAN